MTHSIANPASFLVDNIALFERLEISTGVLDLACGTGRNGLFLLSHNVPVIFADNNETSLQSIAAALEAAGRDAKGSECWSIDFEADLSEGHNPLAGRVFDAVVVFNYLHRPLFPAIKAAVRPGGLLLYETFTVEQRRFGRPRNPDFLLKCGELGQTFADWECIEEFEGELSEPDRAVARIIARKPATCE